MSWQRNLSSKTCQCTFDLLVDRFETCNCAIVACLGFPVVAVSSSLFIRLCRRCMQPSAVDRSRRSVKPIERLAKVICRTPRQRGCTVSSGIFCRFSLVDGFCGAWMLHQISSFRLTLIFFFPFALFFRVLFFLHLPEWIEVKVETLVGPGSA